MISAIVNILSGIWDFITSVFDVLTWFVSEVISAVALGGRAIAYCASFLGFLPSVLVSALLAFITIKVIFRVKG